MKRILGIVLMFFIANILLLRCEKNLTNPYRKDVSVKIKEIISNPEKYLDETVTIDGYYGGWSGQVMELFPEQAGKIYIHTRSDQLIYDSSGYIYMDASSGTEIQILEWEFDTMDPTDNSQIGSRLKIRSPVSVVEGKPILGKVDLNSN